MIGVDRKVCSRKSRYREHIIILMRDTMVISVNMLGTFRLKMFITGGRKVFNMTATVFLTPCKPLIS